MYVQKSTKVLSNYSMKHAISYQTGTFSRPQSEYLCFCSATNNKNKCTCMTLNRISNAKEYK